MRLTAPFSASVAIALFLLSAVRLGVRLIGPRQPLLTSRRLRRLSALSLFSLGDGEGVEPSSSGNFRLSVGSAIELPALLRTILADRAGIII